MAGTLDNKLKDLLSAGKNVAEKTASGTKSIANQVAQKVEKEKEKAAREVSNDSKKLEESRRRAMDKESTISTEYMSKTELWSWLKTKSDRQKYFTEQESNISVIDFMKMVNARMHKNGVPARVNVKKIQWDRSNVSRTVFYIDPAVKIANPLTRIVQFEHIGKYTFVEEKTFITPPNLPDMPMKQLSVNQKSLLATLFVVWFGAMFVMLSFETLLTDSLTLGSILLLAFLGVLGVIMICFGFRGAIKARAIRKHNELCKKQEKEWDDAWTNWQKTIFIHAFQEDINGHLSRIFDSASACIKQVSNEEFRDAVASVEENVAANMNELEQLINRRKEEYR